MQSEIWFPKNPKYYPKNLHTKIIESENPKVGTYAENQSGNRTAVVPGSTKCNGPVSLICSVTGAPAKYRDPLTG